MSEERRFTRRDLATFAQYAMTRYKLAQQVGQTAFGGAREYYRALGYTEGPIQYVVYRQRYDRQDVASRIVDLPAQDSWKKPPAVTEHGDGETAFAKAWTELADSQLGVWGKLMRADKLSGIGCYGILLLGFADGGKLAQPVGSASALLYLRPFPEGMVDILTYEDDSQNPRYGLPVTYKVELSASEREVVHWERVIHLAEGKTDNEVFGTPRLQKVFNRLDDLIKVVGGAAEASWYAMRPGTVIQPKEDYELDMTAAEIEEELERYSHDPMRMLWMAGVDVQEVARPVVIDPTKAYEPILALIATATGIPQRVLQGSAQGELAAATADLKQWAGEVAHRQKNYVEPEVFRPFVDRLIAVGILPPPGEEGYTVGTEDENGEYRWPSLLSMDELEESEITRNRAIAIKQLSDPAAEYPLADSERRQTLGFPEEWPEGEEPEEEEAGDLLVLPDLESIPAETMANALDNFRNGDIDAEQLATFAILELTDA